MNRRELGNQFIAGILLAGILIVWPLTTAWSTPVFIDDFEGNAMVGWSWTTGTTTQNYTAEASPHGLVLAPAGVGDTYSIAAGANWDGYRGHYIGFYLYSTDGLAGDTLDIIITEGDWDGTIGEELQPWDLTNDIVIDWTGWRYIMRRLPDGTTVNDFQATATSQEGGIANFDPVPGVAPQTHRGVISIQFQNNSAAHNLYIDEINISRSNPIATVVSTFPRDGTTLDRLLPTISAVFDANTDVAHLNTNIFITQQDLDLGDTDYYSIDGLVDYPNDVRDDGVSGLFATPNDTVSDAAGWGAYTGGGPFVVFIMPANSDGDFGQAEVITFSVSPPGTAVGVEYHREVTE